MIGQDFMEKAAGACGDFFERIDELLLLDFPGEEEQEEIGGGGEIGGGLEGCTLPPVSAAGEFEALSGSYAYSGDSACSVENDFAAGLSVPCEDIEQLEWLSNFFEDSFSDEKLFFSGDDTKDSSRYRTPSPVSVLETQPVQLSPERLVPGRARSKRPRPASFSPRTELSTGSEEFPRPKKMKGEKKKKKKRVDSVRVDSVQARRCKHCGIEKTPQWRMGPTGPKTLCNACGVRYKSGRLFPEYRPAASPTFVEAIHSNSHKKVMEMRLKFGKGAI